MDIKKFITASIFEDDYNKIIKLEQEAIKNKSNNKKHNDTEKTKCLYPVSECDFFTVSKTINDVVKDQNIIEFESMCDDDIDKRSCLAYSGSMIKRYFDPNYQSKSNTTLIENCYVVTMIDPSGTINVKNIIKDAHKKNLETKHGFYVLQLESASKSIFYLDKKTSPTISLLILSNNDTMDRVSLYNNELWVSGMFILDFYKKISCYDTNNIDPVFGYPEDILGIYDRTVKTNDAIKDMIDIVDYDAIQSIGQDRIEKTFIMDGENRYTVIEYLITKMVAKDIHLFISYQMMTMMTYLMNFQYLRPIFFIARLTGFDKMYPGLFASILETDSTNRLNINPNVDTTSLETINHVDMFIINHLIKTDNEDMFVDYIIRTGIIKKFGLISTVSTFTVQSKTVEKIVEWIIEYNPLNIINTLIECAVLSDRHRYMIIFLTQNFDLLGKEFLLKYVLKRDPVVKKRSLTNNETDVNIDASNDIIDNTSENTSDNTSDSTTDNTTDNTTDSISDNTIDIKFQLDTNHQELVLNVLPEVINRGLTRSFYMILKLCPYILDKTFESASLHLNTSSNGGNILHMIRSEGAVKILDIILNKNIELIDERDNDGMTPLILYSVLRLNECIHKLLDFGADYELLDNHFDTFLHKLCYGGSLDIIQNVVRRVISIIDTKNDFQMTPAIIATSKGYEEIFYVLKGLNADLDATDVYGNTVYHYICLSKICPGILIVNRKNRYGVTPYEYCKLSPKYYHFHT